MSISAATMSKNDTTHHFMEGFASSSATFIPKKEDKNVAGRKRNVTQLRRHRLVFSSRD